MINFDETKIYNAKVKFSYLGKDDNGKLYYQLGFDFEKGTISTSKKYIEAVNEIDSVLSVLDLRSWEEVARKFARIKIMDKQVIEIGNLIENRWVRI